MYNHESSSRPRSGWLQSRLTTWVLLGFLAVGAFFLFTEHTAHVLGLLPYAVFLLCPVMMFFMMRGMHGGHGGHDEHNREDGSRIPPEGGQQ
jgi:hypothetical protein